MRAALDGLAGIATIEIDLDRDAFSVCYQVSELSVNEIIRTIAGLGFRPRLAGKDEAVTPTRTMPPAAAPEPLASALAEARETKRLIFIDFYAEWCAPCKVLEEIVFPAPEVQKALEGYVFMKVDTDESPEVGQYLNVVAMPTLLVLDARGKEIHRSIGMIDVQDLVGLLNELRESVGRGRSPVPKDSTSE